MELQKNTKYPKIQTLFYRDPKTKFKTVLEWEYALPEFVYLQNNIWEWREKVDGTNLRIIFDVHNNNIIFAGRTADSNIPPFLLNALHNIFDNKMQIITEIFDISKIDYCCLYGEGYGNKIQKNGHLYRNDCGFALFDVQINNYFLRQYDIEDIAKKLSIEIAPIIGAGTLIEMVQAVKNGFNSKWGDFLAEGIVALPAFNLCDRLGNRIITKLKYNDFLH